MGVILQVHQDDGSVVNLATLNNVVEVKSNPVATKVIVQNPEPPVTIKVTTGAAGLSAYQVALNDGFVGTVTQWLDSLKGADGDSGVIDTSNFYTKSQVDTIANTKEPGISSGTSTQYWRGDKTWQTLDKTSVGLGNVNNTSDVNKPVSTAQQTALDAKGDKSITFGVRKRSAANETTPTDSNYDARPVGYSTVISIGALPPPVDMQTGDIHWEIVP